MDLLSFFWTLIRFLSCKCFPDNCLISLIICDFSGTEIWGGNGWHKGHDLVA